MRSIVNSDSQKRRNHIAHKCTAFLAERTQAMEQGDQAPTWEVSIDEESSDTEDSRRQQQLRTTA